MHVIAPIGAKTMQQEKEHFMILHQVSRGNLNIVAYQSLEEAL